jgi:hypothetical protein
VQNNVFLNVAPCSLADLYHRFRRTVCRRLEGRGFQCPQKGWYISTRLHDFTPQKTILYLTSLGTTFLSSNFTDLLQQMFVHCNDVMLATIHRPYHTFDINVSGVGFTAIFRILKNHFLKGCA